MGACASCLGARNKSVRSDFDETRPLLDEQADNYTDGNPDDSDEISQQRQQELVQIVQSINELFIDIPSISSGEQLETGRDVSELVAAIESKLDQVELKLPDSIDLSEQSRERLTKELNL